MKRTALAKKYNDTVERKEMRRLLWRWGRVNEFCLQSNQEMKYFQDRISEVGELCERAQIKVSGGKVSDPTESAVESLERLQREFESCVCECADTVHAELSFKALIDEIIQSDLLPEEKELLILRYKKGWSWLMISSKMCLAERTARNREQNALDKIAKKVNVRQKCAV